uniref:Serine/arginine repetitive matrix protein 1 n=1 Tax=Zea mays TaxID=4577 RepID=B6T974_MAIZE|nr:serine/arginine repetitive matrix protein 1 [Zea mays]
MASATGNSSLRRCSSLPNLLVWLLNLSLLVLTGRRARARSSSSARGRRPSAGRSSPCTQPPCSPHSQRSTRSSPTSASPRARRSRSPRCPATRWPPWPSSSATTTASASSAPPGTAGSSSCWRSWRSYCCWAMFMAQAVALAATCVLSRRWAREYQEAETEKAAAARKRGRKMARVQAESAAAAEAGVKAVDEKVMRSSSGKKVHWANNDGYEEC